MNDGPIDRAVYSYDEAGRHIRTMQLNHDGTQTVLEVCSYDADGRKTKVRLLFSREADSGGMPAEQARAMALKGRIRHTALREPRR